MKRIFKFISLSAMTLMLSGLISPDNLSGKSLKEYWLLNDFLDQHPEQKALSSAFSRTVKGPGRAAHVKQMRPVKIVMIYPGLQVSDYWRRSVSSFRARMRELGLKFVLEDHFTKPGTGIREQSLLIGEAMANSPDYLVFTLDAMRHRGMIERVMAEGQTKVILQNITTPIREFGQFQPFFYVGFDHGVGAKMLADRFKAKIKNSGRYAIFYGPKGYVSRMRGGIFLQEMSARPEIELVASYYVNFDRQRSYRAAMELLSEHDKLDFIYACSTDIALGIIDALKETGRLNSVMVNGWGGGEAELDAISRGEMDFTAMRMNDDNGVAMAEAIRLDLETPGAAVPTVYSGEFRMVGKKTPKVELARLRKNAFRYSK